MPQLPESSYTLSRLPAGLLFLPLTLMYGLLGLVGSLQAAEPEPSAQPEDSQVLPQTLFPSSQSPAFAAAPSTASPTSPVPATAALPTHSPANPATLASNSAGDVSLTSAPPQQGVFSSPSLPGQSAGLPAMLPAPSLAQVPIAVGTTPTGMPVPWQMAPYASASQPGQLIDAPGVAPAGTWMMVWVPYGVPGTVGAPGTGGQVPYGVPYSSPYGVAYPAWIPSTVPTAIPAGSPSVGSWSPVGAFSAGYPYAGVPWSVPSVSPSPYAYPPYGYPPYAYGVAPTTPGYATPGAYTSPNPALFSSIPVSPAVPNAPQPLSVPTAPTIRPGTVPPPPAQPLSVIPAASQPVPLLPGTQPLAPTAALNPWALPPTMPGPNGQSLQESVQTAASTTATPLVVADTQAPLTRPTLDLQGLYILQNSRSSARARLNGSTFLTPNLMVGGTLDVVTGPDLTNSDGVQITELYLATAIPNAPGLRFRLGQLDLTSYFDRNSFAKDNARDFFNPTFNTNPALIAGANVTASRIGGLVQWAINDDITLSASAFSSAPGLSDFALDGFASEISFRTGNLILRGTYITSKDTEFQGTQDRLNAYGINAEWFIPEADIGFFGRYGRLNNTNTGLAADTYSLGMTALDLFMDNDRLGLAYGRNLSTASVRGLTPDALEVFYDFEVIPNVRIGFTFQQLNQFTESVAGFRIQSGLDLTPSLSLD